MKLSKSNNSLCTPGVKDPLNSYITDDLEYEGLDSNVGSISPRGLWTPHWDPSLRTPHLRL